MSTDSEPLNLGHPPKESWLLSRLSHLRKITRWGWFVIWEVGWLGLFTNIDLVVSKYGSARVQYNWERLTHPHWGWTTWVIGALTIAVFFLWEGSYREHHKDAGTISQLETLLSKQPRPQLIIAFDHSQRPSFTRTLQGVILSNVGGVSAHNARIVPDKSKGYWIEQIGQVGMIVAGGDCSVTIRAMYLEADKTEHCLLVEDEPLKELLVSMTLSGLVPELLIALRYESFDGQIYETPFRFGVDDQKQPCFTLLS
jgi:hypothetical protein